MNTTLSFSLTSSSILKNPSPFLLPSITYPRTKLGFLRPPKPIPTSTFTPLSHPPLPSILHRDDEEDEDDDNEEDEFVAEEYDEAAGVSEEEDYDEDDGFRLSSASSSASPAVGTTWSEEPKWKRVERLRSQVRELGDGIIDVEELASIYDFPIDKFQVKFLFLVLSFVHSVILISIELECAIYDVGMLRYVAVSAVLDNGW